MAKIGQLQMPVIRKKMRIWIPLLVLLTGAVVYNLLLHGHAVSAALVGLQAPDLTLESLQGQPVSLANLRGKPVLLNFWASWCEPCQAETPDLIRFTQQHKDQIAVYGINWTGQDQLTNVNSFVNKMKINYPVLLDRQGQAADAFKIVGTPTTYLLDAQGKIVAQQIGMFHNEQEMERFVQKVLH
ncbi:MAG: alkyl hydroperoxide reductase/Thiol specific antioxidant/Mal allergen [Bacilli bacterium]|nr:alkyl hydroperoxide reductase/Thiol specific antioxidant/Mal allergen [Bacilli bacterium]